MPRLTINPATLGPIVSVSHFGTNYLADREARHNQGIEGDNVFGHAADMLGTNTFRYPGGAITEMFLDLADPRHFTAGADELIEATDRFTDRGETFLTPVGQFLNFVNERDGNATIVLPTITYFDALASRNPERVAAVKAEIKSFIINTLQHPGGKSITAFEIGNEYVSWSKEHHGWLIDHSRDYAMLARNISVWIDEAIDDSGASTDPEIIIQSSFFPRGPNGNNQLIKAFFDNNLRDDYGHVEALEKAAAAITATSIHSYPYTAWELDAYKGLQSIHDDLEMINDWQKAFDTYNEGAGQPSREISAYVTEWNTRSEAIKNRTISGIAEATAILSQFNTLLRGGVDEMHIWPLLQGSRSNLVNGNAVEDLSFDFNGFIFSRMHDDLISKRVMNIDASHDLDGDADDDLLTFAYEGANELTIYVASISLDDVQASLDFSDLSKLATDYDLLEAVRIFTSTQDPLDPYARPAIRNLEINELEGTMKNDGVFDVSLAAYEIIEFNFSIHELKQMFTDEPYALSSSVEGHGADESNKTETFRYDLLPSTSGQNETHGYAGDDVLDGGEGSDTLDGGFGNDVLRGGGGNDWLIYGAGADLLSGDAGNDTFTLSGTMYHTAQYAAFNVTSATQTGTGQVINLAGKLKIEAIIDGGAGVNTIDLSNQGDAFFLHDAYSGFHHSLALTADYVGNDSTQRFINVQNINGLGGDDIIDLTSPDYSLAGKAMRIEGGEGHDVIWGSDANETIYGGIGNDTIFGGVGTDVLFGGAGADEFQFTKTSTETTVMDFDPTDGDSLKFFNTETAIFDATSLVLTETGVRIAYEEAGARHEIDIALAASADQFSWSLSEIASATDFF